MLLFHHYLHQLAWVPRKEVFEQLHIVPVVLHLIVQQELKVYQLKFRNQLVLLIHLYQYLKYEISNIMLTSNVNIYLITIKMKKTCDFFIPKFSWCGGLNKINSKLTSYVCRMRLTIVVRLILIESRMKEAARSAVFIADKPICDNKGPYCSPLINNYCYICRKDWRIMEQWSNIRKRLQYFIGNIWFDVCILNIYL